MGGANADTRVCCSAGCQSRMAAALCGLSCSSGGNSKPARTREPRRRVKDSRRRRAALLFLNNISLDGRPLCQLNARNDEQRAAEEPWAGGTTLEQLGDGPAPQQVTEGSAAGSGSSSTFTGVFSPVRPSMVTSPSVAASIGANEVFLESSGAVEALAPDTPLSPVPAGHPPCSRAKSMPAALSPVPTGQPVDSRPRWAHSRSVSFHTNRQYGPWNGPLTSGFTPGTGGVHFRFYFTPHDPDITDKHNIYCTILNWPLDKLFHMKVYVWLRTYS